MKRSSVVIGDLQGVAFVPAPVPPRPPLHLFTPRSPDEAIPVLAVAPFVSRLLAYDSETSLAVPGDGAPDLVCASVAQAGPGGVVEAELLDREGALALAREVLGSDRVLVGAHVAYDLAVLGREDSDLLPLVFLALEEARVVDVLLAQALDAVGRGHLGIDPLDGSVLTNDEGQQTRRYNLWNVVRMVLGRGDAKENNAWRLSYGLLRGFPVSAYPRAARTYGLDDARNPLEVFLAQAGLRPDRAHKWHVTGVASDGFLEKRECVHCHVVWDGEWMDPEPPCVERERSPHMNLDNHPEQVETSFALQLGGVRGIRTDGVRVEALRREAQTKRDRMTLRYQALGFLRADGSENQVAVRRAIALAYGGTGICSRCGGRGRLERTKTIPCRGEKVRGRYPGCSGVGCATCGGSGVAVVSAGDATCQMADGGCDGTGLDVRTAPTLRTITTPTGRISTSRDTLMESGDEDLHDYGESEHDKVLDTYVPFLLQGIDRPINLSANVILESTRASYKDVIQLIPRKGGVRECFVARDGYDFCSVDYSAIELCTLAQVALLTVGYSRMAEVINRTKDPGMLHTSFGARMIGISIEEMSALVAANDIRAKNTRDAAKAGNFTFGGGGGAAATVLANRAKAKGTTKAPDGFEYVGIRFCILLDGAERCGERKQMEWGGPKKRYAIPPTCVRCLRVVQEVLRPSWYAEWPEMKPYFDWVTRVVGDSGRGVIPCFGRKFWQFDRERGFLPHPSDSLTTVVTRGGVGFTDGTNNGFQSLAAAGAKYALRCVTREAYLGARLDDLGPDEWVAFLGPERRPHVVKRRSARVVREATPSPLAGTRPIFFAHDEIFSEMPSEMAHLAALRKVEVMRWAMRAFVPDVYIGAKPALMKYWSKDAEAVYQEGRLVRWEPKSARGEMSHAK